ncbi:hypothetical protein TNCT_279051 [Trichonephila clavata]|uniref:Uncharacterized protein n=1 Tax=Trichonephila clavata TaxID=2740835 RepID=A0A8X6JKK8_TRICU|nr:hypothetical protein TNCT_279051 [Trichonephila clavata]
MIHFSCLPWTRGNASAAVHEILRRKNLLRGPMSTKGIRAMIKRSEETGKLGVQTGRGRKRIPLVLVDAVKTDVDIQSQTSEFGDSNARAVSRQTGYSTAPSKKYSEKIMHNFPYMIL